MSDKQGAVIYRLMTPMAAGALAVVRLAGVGARRILEQIFRPHASRPIADWPEDRLCFGRIYDGDELIDQAIVAVGPPVDGAAGEQVDIGVHGGVRVVQRLGLCLQRMGATLADAHAPAWPVCDAIDAEALHLLPTAATERAAVWLAAQRSVLAERIRGLIGSCADASRLPELAAALHGLLAEWSIHRRLVYGTQICLWGPANAGKSSLANVLAGASGSIVSSQPATTRDWVARPTAIDGVPITLIDVAGADQHPGELEAEALRRAAEQAAKSEFLLVVLDASRPWSPDNARAWASRPAKELTLIAANKSDLPSAWRQVPAAEGLRITRTCALHAEGVIDLQKHLAEALQAGHIDPYRPGLFTTRQVGIVRQAAGLLETASPQEVGDCLRCLLSLSGHGESPGQVLDRSDPGI
jgi:tRNA modification GTPase